MSPARAGTAWVVQRLPACLPACRQAGREPGVSALDHPRERGPRRCPAPAGWVLGASSVTMADGTRTPLTPVTPSDTQRHPATRRVHVVDTETRPVLTGLIALVAVAAVIGIIGGLAAL